jgi:predicted PurR-regulated permease PerM
MIAYSPVHWIVLLAVCAIIVFPVWRIFSRIGLPGALSLLMIVPLINLITLWIVAFIAWPRDKTAANLTAETF